MPNVPNVAAVSYCGTLDPAKNYYIMTCSSNEQIQYATFTSSSDADDYTGFRLFYERKQLKLA